MSRIPTVADTQASHSLLGDGEKQHGASPTTVGLIAPNTTDRAYDDTRRAGRRRFLSGLGFAGASVAAATIVDGLNMAHAAPADTAVTPADRSTIVPSVCVFDVNGSLLNTDALGPLFERLFGNPLVVREWYAELALYSNVITMSGSYPGTFIALGQAVLQMVADYRHVQIHPHDIEELKTRLLTLPAYPDVLKGLQQLKAAGFRLVTLTNSPPGPQGSGHQLESAGITGLFERHFNTQGVRAYKVAPSVYHMVAETLDLPTAACCMITAHAWDALGAQFVGFSSGLMHRPGQASMLLHGLPQPLAIAADLPGLATQLIALRHQG